MTQLKKIILFTMDDPVFSYEIIHELIESGIKFEAVIFFNNPPISMRRLGVLFFVYGPIFFIKFVVLYIYWNILKGGRIKKFLDLSRVSHHEFSQYEMPKAMDFVENISPDLMVSVFCNIKLPHEMLSLAKIGGINLHQGKLPDYRGLMPIFYCQINGENTIGSSVHLMSDKFDAGQIIAEGLLPISAGDDYPTLWKSINKIGAKNLINVINAYIQTGQLQKGRPQPYLGKYYGLPTIKMALFYWIDMTKSRLRAKNFK